MYKQVILYHEVFSAPLLTNIMDRAAGADMSHMYRIYEEYLRYETVTDITHESFVPKLSGLSQVVPTRTE